ncbi:FMN-binding protein [Clostridium akagii]|uniref:FMN-binding protein n=1 Tax=Clostridium akagii TaxID=91623 RepID=UPI00047AB342|nr:FMN-binding protein [Clostridium akagii]
MLSTKKIVITAVCIVALTVGIFGGRYIISVEKYKKTIKEIKIGTVDLSKISDGTYTGSFDAVYIAAKVSVTVKDNKITNIVLLNHKNERGKPAEVIPEKVVEAQSLQVDTISGATNSSKVILKSIENALESAKS